MLKVKRLDRPLILTALDFPSLPELLISHICVAHLVFVYTTNYTHITAISPYAYEDPESELKEQAGKEIHRVNFIDILACAKAL
jgi:hypothetical protein